MVEKRNLCAQIPLPLFNRVGAEREKSGLTNAEYITLVLTEYFEWKENGGTNMAKNSGKDRTLAFQISEDLFNRIKAHLERETARTGKKLTQRDFVLGLIEVALAEAEQAEQAEAEWREAGEAESAVSAESVPESEQETGQESAEAEAGSGGDEETPQPSEPEEEADDEAALETDEDNGQTENVEDASADYAAT